MDGLAAEIRKNASLYCRQSGWAGRRSEDGLSVLKAGCRLGVAAAL
ncbi:MAG: hypothetical protein AB7D06_00265 [Pedobacter sp.]